MRGDSSMPTVIPARCCARPIGGGGEPTVPGKMERMTLIDRPSARRSVDALTAIGFGVLASAPEPGLFMALLTGIAAIAIGLWSRGPRAGLGGLAVLVVVSMARATWLDGHWLYVAEELPPALMRAGVPWLIGLAVRQYIVLGRRADRERELRQVQRLAELKERATADRLALAQALHDDLGHSLSLVALNLGRLEIDPALPESARTSLLHARNDLAHAVERLGDSVSDLRSGAPVLPMGAASVDALLARARAAGARITVQGLPEPRRLQDFGGEQVTRVLQEAITNASRHAPGTPIDITAADAGAELRLKIENALGETPADAHTAGTGLSTLESELRAHGGELAAEKTDSAFVLSAVLPTRRQEQSTHDDRAVETTRDVDERSTGRTKLRQRLILASTAAIVVVGLAAVEALTVVQNHRALLSAGAFSSISVGDTRAETERILPGHELPASRGENRPDDCHDYAVTANTFDDAAGDVYRICFAQDKVSSTEYIAGGQR